MSLMTTSLTADEFLAGDYPVGSELIDGEVYMNDPGFPHQEVVGRIFVALWLWVASEVGYGRAGHGGNWVLADRHVYKPDVGWAATRPTGGRHDGPPDLAVEVRAPGTWRRDIGPKLRQYEASGTRELWLADTPARTVLVFRGAAFDHGSELGAGQQLTSPLLPGFTLDVDELFADLD
jgi:Uma2 family endonuclease